MRRGDGGSLKLHKESVPVPKPGPEELLVRVSYVAQNPTDSTLGESFSLL